MRIDENQYYYFIILTNEFELMNFRISVFRLELVSTLFGASTPSQRIGRVFAIFDGCAQRSLFCDCLAAKPAASP